jgi:FixJ family two-component response regulator
MKRAESIVFIVDDDASVRSALKSLIRSVGLEVEGFASSQEFLEFHRPDVAGCIVLDVRLPGISGLDFHKELLKTGIQLPIIFITAHGDVPMSVRAMKAGAVEFLTKPFRDQDLLDAIQLALNKDRTRRQLEGEIADLRERFESLTARERELLALVVSGKPNKQIADAIGISEFTVKVHRANLTRKMRAESLADLVRMTVRLNVPESPGPRH